MRRVCTAAVILVACIAGTATADRLTEAPVIETQRPLGQRLLGSLEALSAEFDTHLSVMSFNILSMRFDARNKTTRLTLNAGAEEGLFCNVLSDVVFRNGAAGINTHIDLGVGEDKLSFTLPEIEMVPRSFGGKRYVELRLPLLSGAF